MDRMSSARSIRSYRHANIFARVRKQIKIRPGFTPQEDVSRFRGTKQAQMDANTFPKGHIIGWTPPPAAASSSSAKTKSQKKNEKRKEKRKAEKAADTDKVKDDWEDEEEDDSTRGSKGTATQDAEKKVHTSDKPNWAAAPEIEEKAEASSAGDKLADELGNLDVR